MGGRMMELDKQLFIENTAAVRGLSARLEEFEKHVMGRVERLEKNEGERNSNLRATVSLIIASASLAVSIIINFFRNGGK
jgi:hypothetical protein